MIRTLFILFLLAISLRAEELPYRGPEINGPEVYGRINDQLRDFPTPLVRFAEGQDCDAKEPLFSKTVHLDPEAYRKDAVRKLGEKLSAGPREPLEIARAYGPFIVAVLIPDLHPYRNSDAQTRLTIDLLSTWCRLELLRLEKGKYPDSLEAVGKVPADPYDGKPLKYRRAEEGGEEKIVITTTGPKDNWEERVRRAIVDGAFDPADSTAPDTTLRAVRRK